MKLKYCDIVNNWDICKNIVKNNEKCVLRYVNNHDNTQSRDFET